MLCYLLPIVHLRMNQYYTLLPTRLEYKANADLNH